MRSCLSLAALSAVFVVGCNQSPPGGSPGTADNFKIIGPTMTAHIKQSEKEALKFDLNRGRDFKKDVKLSVSVDAPKGLKAELNKDVVKASDKPDFSVSIAVEKDAALGEHVVKVTGTPEGGGSPTTVEVKVKVEKL